MKWNKGPRRNGTGLEINGNMGTGVLALGSGVLGLAPVLPLGLSLLLFGSQFPPCMTGWA